MKWHEVPLLRPGFNRFGQIDPYIDWSFGTGRSKLFVESETSRFPLLLQLADGLSASDFSTGAIFGQGGKPNDWKETVRVPPLYLHNGDGFGGCSYFTTFVTKRFFKYFSEQDWGDKLVHAIARMAVSGNLRDHTFPVEDPAAEPGQQSPIGNAEIGTVVIGVIDDGIAFANERFRTADNRSRVEHIWLQDGTYKAPAARYGYGCSLSKRDASGVDGIDTLLSRSTYSGLVDEDEVYAKAGAIAFGGERPWKLWVLRTGALRASHGTHVMDIACGYAPGAAPKNESTRGEDSRPIVCVQLPAASSEGTSGASLDTFAVDGIGYILDKADEIARRPWLRSPTGRDQLQLRHDCRASRRHVRHRARNRRADWRAPGNASPCPGRHASRQQPPQAVSRASVVRTRGTASSGEDRSNASTGECSRMIARRAIWRSGCHAGSRQTGSRSASSLPSARPVLR